MLPLGIARARDSTAAPYVVVAHGAEITGLRPAPGLAPVRPGACCRGAAGIVAAGTYPARSGPGRGPPACRASSYLPVSTSTRFRPIDDEAKKLTRAPLRARSRSSARPRPLAPGAPQGLRRRHRRVRAAARRAARDRRGRSRPARGSNGGPAVDVRFLGRVPDADLPALYACADVFAMCCRERWGGLEAEGFGIVFLEAAACGVPAVAGRSGGSHEAVADGETGFVVDAEGRARGTRRDPATHRRRGARELGWATRPATRAVTQFSYDVLADQLRAVAAGTALSPLDSCRAAHTVPHRSTGSRCDRASGSCSARGRRLACSRSSPVLDASVIDAFDPIAVGVCLALFLASLPVWIYALGLAIVRSAHGRRHRGGEPLLPPGFGAAPRTASTCSARSRSASSSRSRRPGSTRSRVLVPMLPLGLVGLWGARHGTFPPRARAAAGTARASTRDTDADGRHRERTHPRRGPRRPLPRRRPRLRVVSRSGRAT